MRVWKGESFETLKDSTKLIGQNSRLILGEQKFLISCIKLTTSSMEQNNCAHLYSVLMLGVIYITDLFILLLIGQVWLIYSANKCLQTS